MTVHAKVHDARRGRVQEAKNDEQRANRCHSLPESLGKVNISGYSAPGDEKIKRDHVTDEAENRREQLEVVFSALPVASDRGSGATGREVG